VSVARAGRERGRESLVEGASEQGKWASGAHGSKGTRACEVAGEHEDMGASMAGTWAGG
jgi:hypothetical protein